MLASSTLDLIVVSLIGFVSMIMLTAKLFWPSGPPNDFGDYPNRPQ
ncbi:hypothetical protein IHQ71_01750 [Rhizobium sp. TH2]|nr:hypothetical protein [Rhizobium sp. TH2]UVC09378.1 hypothetical protein IHQ71_01750 [Rhizobium sp. TH2]